MLYSIKHNFIFIHCPRTSGTALSMALKSIVPDAVYELGNKHVLLRELPASLRALRSFTIHRPHQEVRASYYAYIRKWLQQVQPHDYATPWLIDHARRLAKMSLAEYLVSNEPPINTADYSRDVDVVFQYANQPYRAIGEFCKVSPDDLELLMQVKTWRNG